MSFGWDLPPGVSHSHPHFNPPLCPCGADAPCEGEKCDECDRLLEADGYVDPDELRDREYDRAVAEAEDEAAGRA